MPANILQEIEGIFDDDTTHRIAEILGESSEAVAGTLQSTVAAIASAALRKSATFDGAERLFRDVSEFDGTIRKDFRRVIKEQTHQELLCVGERRAKDLFGEEGAFLTRISDLSGVSIDSARTLLQLVTALVLDLAGEEQRQRSLNRDGVSKYFEAQKTLLATELPAKTLQTMELIEPIAARGLDEDKLGLSAFAPGGSGHSFTPPLKEAEVDASSKPVPAVDQTIAYNPGDYLLDADWTVESSSAAEDESLPAEEIHGHEEPAAENDTRTVAVNEEECANAAATQRLEERTVEVPVQIAQHLPLAETPDETQPLSEESKPVTATTATTQPVGEHPEAVVPEAAVPESAVPEAAVPESAVPESVVPKAVVPESVVPEAVVPEAVVPEAVVPEAVVPESVVPEAVVPESVVPEPVVSEADRNVSSTGSSEFASDEVVAVPTPSEDSKSEPRVGVSAKTNAARDEQKRDPKSERRALCEKALLPLLALASLWIFALSVVGRNERMRVSAEAAAVAVAQQNDQDSVKIDLGNVVDETEYFEVAAVTPVSVVSADDQFGGDDPFDNKDGADDTMAFGAATASNEFVELEPADPSTHPSNVKGFMRVGDLRIPVFDGPQPTGRSYYSTGRS